MNNKIDNEVDTLKSHISTILAPAILDIMEELGYETSFKYYDDNKGEHKLPKSELLMVIEKPDIFFQPYSSAYENNEDKNDKIHMCVLREFNDLKEAFIALHNRKNEAKQGIKWIENIGIIYERKVIIEKFKQQHNASNL